MIVAKIWYKKFVFKVTSMCVTRFRCFGSKHLLTNNCQICRVCTKPFLLSSLISVLKHYYKQTCLSIFILEQNKILIKDLELKLNQKI